MMKNILILAIAAVGLVGCKSSQDKDDAPNAPAHVHVPKDILENYYYLDRAVSQNSYKEPVINLYTTKKLYMGWRPVKEVVADDLPIEFQGTFVKYFAGKDQIISQETSTELNVDRFNKELYFKAMPPMEESKMTQRNKQGYTIPYSRVTNKK